MTLLGLVDNFWHLSDSINVLSVNNKEVIDSIYKITNNKCIIIDENTYNDNKNNDIFKTRNFVVGNIDEIKEFIDKNDNTNNLVVIGNEALYNALLDNCNTAFIVRTDRVFRSTSYFPQLINIDNWRYGFTKHFDDSNYSIERYYNINKE